MFAKYTLRADEMFLNRMIGGTFEGSNDPDFREKEVLYLINEKPKRLQTVVQSYSSKSYRYVRYIGPKDSHCNIAEAAFYTPNDTASLKGKVMVLPDVFKKMVRMSIQMYLMGMSQLLLIILSLPVAGQGLILELLSRLGRLFIRLGTMIIMFVMEMIMNYSTVAKISGNLLESKPPMRIH